jgi:hypothetical protein
VIGNDGDMPTRCSAAVTSCAIGVLVAVAAIAGCGPRDRGAIEIDLTSPKTPTQIDPETRTSDLATIDGPAEFTVRIPQRTYVGRYRAVNVYSPVLDDVTPANDPSRAVRTLDLRYEFTDDADELVARLDELLATEGMADEDRAELPAWRDEFRSKTAERGGEIVQDDLPTRTGSNIRDFTIEDAVDYGSSLQFRIGHDGTVAMTLFIGFDNGIEQDADE